MPRFTAGVVGVVVNEAGKILLLEHDFHTIYPWGLPGGWIDRRENPGDAAVREVMEETRLSVVAERPLVVRSNPHRSHLDFAYLCRLNGSGDVNYLSYEILSAAWIDPSQLPPMAPFHRQAVEAALSVPFVRRGDEL